MLDSHAELVTVEKETNKANNDMQETWKRFVYPLIEDKKQDVEEEAYHRHIENQLMLLGWEPWKREIIHKQSLRIGNRNRGVPVLLGRHPEALSGQRRGPLLQHE